MNCTSKGQGFTLIELLIAVAIIAIISALALPAYNNYVKRTKIAIAEQSAEGLRSALEDYWIDNRTYVAGANVAALTAALGWSPGDVEISAMVEAGAAGIATSYKITAWHADAADDADKVIISYSR